MTLQYRDSLGAPYRERDQRGPQWFAYGSASAGRYAYVVADTEAEIAQGADQLRGRGFRTVQVYAPDGQTSPDAVARRLTLAREELDAATREARAMAHRLAEQNVAETVIATTLGVTRMTIRSWLGK